MHALPLPHRQQAGVGGSRAVLPLERLHKSAQERVCPADPRSRSAKPLPETDKPKHSCMQGQAKQPHRVPSMHSWALPARSASRQHSTLDRARLTGRTHAIAKTPEPSCMHPAQRGCSFLDNSRGISMRARPCRRSGPTCRMRRGQMTRASAALYSLATSLWTSALAGSTFVTTRAQRQKPTTALRTWCDLTRSLPAVNTVPSDCVIQSQSDPCS